MNYRKLWKFVGKKLGVSKKAKVRVEFLSSEKMYPIVKKDDELFLDLTAKANNVSKKAVLEYLRKEFPTRYKGIMSPEETNGIVFTIPFLKKQGLFKLCKREFLNLFPESFFDDYDVLIFVNEGNIEKRRIEWSKRGNQTLTTEEVKTHIVVHEMIHAYERFLGKLSLDKELEPFDFRASSICWKWLRELNKS